ncbi:MAG: phosphatase PAP2-related protein [Candidatus Pacebacteria bacterium]|nr:phosphatase PAP2-related protein [Candidatus Paceibacterota bacterium]
MLKNLSERHKKIWDKATAKSFGLASLFLLGALIFQKLADTYVLTLKEPPVSDILLNVIPSLDIDSFIIQSVLLFTLIVVVLFLVKPKYINFGIKSIALFVLTRSFFITLTHFGANPHQIVFDPNSFGYGLYNFLYNTHNDFFFSGHTGFPFLMAFIFWPEKRWRQAFFIISFVFGISVLLGHIHYSIDVFAAPFITYSIFALARFLFLKDYQLSRGS